MFTAMQWIRSEPAIPRNEVQPMSTREKEILQSFCIISNAVMRKVFHCAHAADCICPDRNRTLPQGVCGSWINFEYSSEVLDYIRKAVFDRMIAEGKL